MLLMKLDVLIDQHFKQLLDAVQTIFLVPVGLVTHSLSLAPLSYVSHKIIVSHKTCVQVKSITSPPNPPFSLTLLVTLNWE